MTGGELFLPVGYSENLPEPVGSDEGLDYWARDTEIRNRRRRRYQDPVYRFAARCATADATVLDVGCGTGDNLVNRVTGRVARAIGVDQPSAVALAEREHPDGTWIGGDLRSDRLWGELAGLRPDVTICADVIEHVDDPVGLLERLREVVGADGVLVLSTPDRSKVEDQPALGPPRNLHHIREWTHPEMEQLVRTHGFAVHSSHHVLPRKYSFNTLEAKMFTWRALHLRAVPARRSCMVFELARA